MCRHLMVATFLVLGVGVSQLFPYQSQNPPKPQSPPGIPSQSSTTRDFSSVVFLSGKVLLEDGLPVPHDAQVEMRCRGRVIQQAAVRKGGLFSFEMRYSKRSSTMDAASSNGTSGFGTLAGTVSPGGMYGSTDLKSAGLGRVDFTDCEIQVSSIPGYYSDPILMGRRSVFDPDVGVIYLHPLAKVKGKTVSANTLLAPRKAVKRFEKARKEAGKKKINYAKVEKELKKALEIYPDFAEAWLMLGKVRDIEKDRAGARKAFEKARIADPNFVLPYLSLVPILMEENQWHEAFELSSRLIDLNPYLSRGQFFHAVSSYQVGEYGKAEESIHSIQVGPEESQYPMIYYLLGAIHAKRGEYPAAAEELNHFLKLPSPPSAKRMIEEVSQRLAQWKQQGLIAKDSDRVEKPDVP